MSIKIVLLETSHPGNIGSVARAMKTMGQRELVLVNPKHFPSQQAVEMASGATDILQTATCVDTFAQAVADCQLVLGTSARARHLSLPLLNPREIPDLLIKKNTSLRSALVFGNERTGLTNQQMELCHYQVVIPTAADYASLNLAQAVQIICYELFQSYVPECSAKAGISQPLAATAAEVGAMITHLQDCLTDSGFLNPQQPKRIMPKLRRLFQRIQLETNEVNLLRGVLTSFQKAKMGYEQR